MLAELINEYMVRWPTGARAGALTVRRIEDAVPSLEAVEELTQLSPDDPAWDSPSRPRCFTRCSPNVRDPSVRGWLAVSGRCTASAGPGFRNGNSRCGGGGPLHGSCPASA